MNSYEKLADAIILQAVMDYRRVQSQLRRGKHITGNEHAKAELEEFFLSDWFKVLTSADGEKILEKLEREAMDRE